MKYCCLLSAIFVTLSCNLKGKKYSGDAIGQYNAQASPLLYFPTVKAISFKDSIPLYDLATILSCLDEKPLSYYAGNTPVIRFVYWHSMSRPKLIRFDNQQIVFKEGTRDPHGIELVDDTSRLSVQERLAYRAIQDYRDSVRSKSADTARMRASNPFVIDKDYFHFLIDKLFAPEETTIPYKLSITAVDQTPLRLLLQKAEEADFWQMPAYITDYPGLDGSDWYLEIMKGSTHHVVHGWSPDAGAFRDLCRYIYHYARPNDREID